MREKFLLTIAALVAFGGSLGAGFVFDDFSLFGDSAIPSPSGWWKCWRITQTRPLTWFTFWANYQVGQQNPVGYHIVNLALHVGVVLLAWTVLRKLIGDRAALAASALFAVHPLLTESVSYVFARATLLATLLSLLAVWAWISERQWLAVGCFAAAMLAKEECAALPVALLLLPKARNVRALAAMFGVAIAVGMRAVWAAAVTPGSGAGPNAGIGPLAYFSAQGGVILRYLREAVVPWGFTIDPEVSYSWVYWIALAIVTAAMLRTRAGVWFVAGLVLLLPSSSIFPAADLAADRRMYLPMLAFCVCAALLVDRRVIAAFVVVYAAISIYYCGVWRNPEALWSEAVRQAPLKARPRVQLARSVPPDRALVVLEGAPDDASVATERGRALLALGRAGEALAEFGRALALDPNDARALNNRGVALSALGQTEAARADFERALARNPCLTDARVNLSRIGIAVASPSSCR